MRFIDACFCRPTDCTPVWLMRQAGRYQPSYRKLREQLTFFELCSSAELSAKVTVDAVEQLGVDAGIIFSDILVPLRAMGAPITLVDAGPRLERPVRDAEAVDRLQVVDPVETMPFVMEAIQLFNKHFDNQVPLIGFAGAPITLAAYLVEGGQSRNFLELKSLLYAAPDVAHRLLGKLAQMVVAHLRAQIEAGCHAVQIFDSWVGILGPDDFREFALPYLQQIFSELRDLAVERGVPRIFFGTDTASLLDELKTIDAEVIGVDWRVSLDSAWSRTGEQRALQGNLDPACLVALDEPQLRERVEDILRRAGGRPGHIFNLGHGVLPQTSVARARRLVELVHELSGPTK